LEKPIKLNGGILVDWRVKNMEFSTISQCCGYGGKKQDAPKQNSCGKHGIVWEGKACGSV
jgi:hypothetical protein